MSLTLDVFRTKSNGRLSKRELTAEVPQTPEALSALCNSLLASSKRLKFELPSFVQVNADLPVGRDAEATFNYAKRFPQPRRVRRAIPEEEEDEHEEDDDVPEFDDELEVEGDEFKAGKFDLVAPKPVPATPLRDGEKLPNLHACDVMLTLKAFVNNENGCVTLRGVDGARSGRPARGVKGTRTLSHLPLLPLVACTRRLISSGTRSKSPTRRLHSPPDPLHPPLPPQQVRVLHHQPG